MANGSSSRLGFVECLRLLAAVVVFVQHLAERYSADLARPIGGLHGAPHAAPHAAPYSAPMAAVAQFGPGLVGVMLFFLISGYVVPMSIRGVFAVRSPVARDMTGARDGGVAAAGPGGGLAGSSASSASASSVSASSASAESSAESSASASASAAAEGAAGAFAAASGSGTSAAGPGARAVPARLDSGAFAAASGGGGFSPGDFLVRRLFRVYPLLIAAFALVFVAGQAGLLARWAWMGQAGALGWAANLLLINEYVGVPAFLGVTWTLAIEFVWYGLFALAVWRWGAGAGLRLALALPAVLVALAGISLALGTRIPLGRITLLYACAVGFLAFLHDAGRAGTGQRDIGRRDLAGTGRSGLPLLSRRALLAHVAGFIVVATGCELVSFGVFAHATISLAQVVWPTVVAPLLFVAVVLSPTVRAAPVMARGVLPAIGSASYSIYLLHPVGLALGDRFGAPHGVLAGAAISLGATGVLALVGYRLVELPGIALGRRVLGRRVLDRRVLDRRARAGVSGAAGPGGIGADAARAGSGALAARTVAS